MSKSRSRKTPSRKLKDLEPKKNAKGGVLIGLNQPVLIGLNQPSLPSVPSINCPSDPSLNFKK